MTDKVQKIREEVERLKSWNNNVRNSTRHMTLQEEDFNRGKHSSYLEILNFIDSLQEEPVSKDKFTFTSLPRLLDRIKPTDRAKWYSSRLADALEKEGYITDAKIVRESIKLMNGEKVPMATMDEESVSEGLEEALEYKVKAIFDSLEKFDVNDKEKNRVAFGLIQLYAYAKMFYNIGKHAGAQWQKKQFEKNRLAACDRQTEEEAEREQDFVMGIIENEHRKPTFDDAIKYGMRLQKEQMMNGAVEVQVNNDPLVGRYINMSSFVVLDTLNQLNSDKAKLIFIKED